MSDHWDETKQYFTVLMNVRDEIEYKENAHAILELLERLRHDDRFSQVRPRAYIMGLVLSNSTLPRKTVYIALREANVYMVAVNFKTEIIEKNTSFVDSQNILNMLSQFLNDDSGNRQNI